MPILAINGRFLTQQLTGVQRYAWELSQAFIQQEQDRWRVVYFIPGRQMLHKPPLGEVHMDTTPFSAHVWEQWCLPQQVQACNADVLWSPCNVGPLFATRQVVTIHDASVFTNAGWYSWWFGQSYRWMLRALGKNAWRVLTPSEFSQQQLIQWAISPSQKIDVVPGGVADVFFTPRAAANPAHGAYVLTVGSRDPKKNLRRLMDAWSQVPAAVKGQRKLLVAGGGAKKFRDEQLGRIPVDVEFLGYVEDEELLTLYVHADSFVFPSLYEGFGLPPLEALACGIPTLVADIPPLRSVCAEAALYCNPLDVADITSKLTVLLADVTLRKQLQKRGPAQADHFRWRHAATRLAAVFAQLLSNRS